MRMKVFVSSVLEHKDEETGEVQNVQLSFAGVCDDGPENKLFWDATPSLSVDCNITNVPAVPEGIKVGDEFFIDFVPTAD
jgi:hypothetical protein